MSRCDDLRIGGTLGASGISGGLSINSTALQVSDWAGLLGVAGIHGSALAVNGRPGTFLAGDLLGRSRFFNLSMRITGWGPVNFVLTEGSEARQIWENTDDLLTALTVPETYLEVDLPDATSRFLRITNLDPAFTTRHNQAREISVPLSSDWPYWHQGGVQESTVVSGATNVAVGGRKAVYDPVLVFAGNGTFTHSTLGWAIQVIGAAGAVTVDLGERTVTEGGSPALNRIRRTPATGQGRVWGWFTPGANSVTSTVSVTVTRRAQFA